MTITRVFEDEHIQAFYLPGRGDRFIISFAQMNYPLDGLSFWGSRPAQNLGYSALGFVGATPNWYPVSSVQAARVHLSELLAKYDTRLTIGSSMGGYAALKFGALFNAQASVAFAPQFTINRNDIPDSENRFRQYYDEEMHRDMKVTGDDVSVAPFILSDPRDLVDRRHVERIKAAAPAVREVPVVNVGHEAVRPFASTTLFRALVEAASAADHDALVRLAREVRKLPGGRSTGMIDHLASKRPRWALAILAKEVEALQPRDAQRFGFILGKRFAADGETALALEAIELGLRRIPNDPLLIKLASEVRSQANQ
ncbi:MAG: hypothetical protein QM759_05645 [Terricaulis sp.]